LRKHHNVGELKEIKKQKEGNFITRTDLFVPTRSQAACKNMRHKTMKAEVSASKNKPAMGTKPANLPWLCNLLVAKAQ